MPAHHRNATGHRRTASAGAVADEAPQYQGVARMANGRWRGYITNRYGVRYEVGDHGTPEKAALAHDRAVLAILGAHASPAALNFRAAFSDTELRFLRGRHAPSPRAAGVIAMVTAGTFDAELARFAARAYDAYTDPELALDVMAFRLAHRDALSLLRRNAAAASLAAGSGRRGAEEAERDVERKAFVEAARNRANDEEWVKRHHLRRQVVGATFEDENRWPPVVPPAEVDVGEAFDGNELVYLPHGSCYVDDMKII